VTFQGKVLGKRRIAENLSRDLGPLKGEKMIPLKIFKRGGESPEKVPLSGGKGVSPFIYKAGERGALLPSLFVRPSRQKGRKRLVFPPAIKKRGHRKKKENCTSQKKEKSHVKKSALRKGEGRTHFHR